MQHSNDKARTLHYAMNLQMKPRILTHMEILHLGRCFFILKWGQVLQQNPTVPVWR